MGVARPQRAQADIPIPARRPAGALANGSGKARMADRRELHVQMVPWMVAGVQTQYVHLERELEAAGIQLSLSQVRPWLEGGRIEKLPLPSRTRGTIRSLLTLRSAFETPKDALWTQVALPMLPFMLTVGWLRKAPVFYAIDCTPKLLFDMDEHYSIAADPGSAKGRLTTAFLKRYFRFCKGLLPWSDWAARSMIDDYGADPDKIHVLPPGIDTSRWKPAHGPARPSSRLRLLFVGADFERKGGQLLLDIYRHHLRDTCDLDIVTRVAVPPEPGVTVHGGFKPDDPGLLQLYQSSDVLVLPTFADCFSMASIEAMACGLPVISSPVGGIPEIVADGETGLLVPAGKGRRLLVAIQALRVSPEMRQELGRAGRERAVRRFNATTQARAMVKIILNAIEADPRSTSPARHSSQRAKSGAPQLETPSSENGPPLTATVVVPTRNRGDLIRETLETLSRIKNPGLEILVVDQSTNDSTRRVVEATSIADPRVRLIATTTVGLSAARNVGARHAAGDVIAYCDDDCIVAAGWLDAILEEFRDPSVQAVYGRILPYEQGARSGLEMGFKPNVDRTEFSTLVAPRHIGHGGNMALRRSSLLELGGFDELLGAGGLFGACEDHDIALRLLRQGRRKIVYSPHALSYHKHWKDWRAQKRMERAYGIGAGAQFAKYIRCGDRFGTQMLAEWIWHLGVRRFGAGALKWRSLKHMYLAYCQLVYPWVGVARSLKHPIDRKLSLYIADQVPPAKESAPAR